MEKQYSRYDFVVSMKSLTRETYIQTPKRNCQQESFQSNGLVWKFHTTGISWSLSRLLSKNNKCLLYQRPRMSNTVCLTVLSRWRKRKPMYKRTPRVQRRLDKKKMDVYISHMNWNGCSEEIPCRTMSKSWFPKDDDVSISKRTQKLQTGWTKRLEGSPSCSHKCVVLLQQNGCQIVSHVGYLLIPFVCQILPALP